MARRHPQRSQPQRALASGAPFCAAAARADHATQATERECALGLSLHAIDVFLPALAAASPPPGALAPLLSPFVTLLAHAGASLPPCLRCMPVCAAAHGSLTPDGSPPCDCEGHPVIADRARTAIFEPLAAGDAALELDAPQLQARIMLVLFVAWISAALY